MLTKDAAIAWLNECRRFFENLEIPIMEDSKYWSNMYNANMCERIRLLIEKEIKT